MSEREDGRARGRHVRGEGAPAWKAPENRFISHSVSADISNWSKGSRGKKLPHGARKLHVNQKYMDNVMKILYHTTRKMKTIKLYAVEVLGGHFNLVLKMGLCGCNLKEKLE